MADIDSNTRSIWMLASKNNVAKNLLGGADSIEKNAMAVVSAVSGEDQERTNEERIS